MTLLNIRGIGSVSSMSNLIVCAQMVFVVVFVALVVRQLAGAESLDLSAPWVGDGSQDGLLPLMAGAAVLCLSFLGFDAVSTLAEETRDPRRDIPRAIVITTLGAGLLFILLAMTSQLAFPGSSFKDADSAASEVMLHAGGRFLEMFFTATYVAGAAGSALASQASVSRILFSMGRDGILPRRVFGTLSERYKTPVVAIVLVSLVSLLAVVIDLTTLASMISFGALVAFSVVNLAVIKSHLGQGQPRSTARLLQYGLLPLIGFALIAWLWTSLSALTLGIGLAWFALGLLYLGIHTRGFRQPAPTVQFSEQA